MSAGVTVDIEELLQKLPNKDDLQAMYLKIEDNHRQEIQELRADIQSLPE